MNAIVGWTHLLRNESLSEAEQIRAVESIDRAAGSQAQLIEDLLDVSRIVSGKLHLSMQPVDVGAVVEAALESQRPSAQAKSIELVWQRPEAVAVTGDADRLQQVVLNLVSNAVKFTPAGGKVEIAVAREGGEARISVKDTGEGIAPEFLPYVFDRFRQADGTSKRKHEGLGLGLEIVRHVISLHGGTVRASSDGAGRGATFTVRLPLASSSSAARAMIAADGTPSEILSSGAGLRVLVVEDDAETREMLGAILDRSGFSYRTASGAASAFEVLDHWLPDVVLSDIGMPYVDGYEFIRQLRARPGESGGLVPALALSAFARSDDRQKALESGYQGHIAKPVDPVDLMKVIHSLTRESRE